MALHLNLFHEIEKRKAQNRRDPLKLSIISLAFVALGFAGYYLYEVGVEHSLSSDLSRLQSDFDRNKPRAEQAAKKEVELNGAVTLSQALVKRVEGRFYWASVLDSLVQIVPREIQITRMAGDVSQDKARRCTITIEGLSAGPEPRKVAEDLRRALSEKFASKYKKVSATFKSLEDGKDNARLDGQLLPTALFSIALQMQTGEDEPAAAPLKRTAKKNDTAAL